MPARSLLLLASVFAFGCEQADERPGLLWTGETIRYAADDPEALCGATLEYLDNRASAMTARLGGPDRIDYYWVNDADLFCPQETNILACADGKQSEIFAEDALLLHEVAHLRGGDGMPSILEEGVAVHFGDPLPLAALSPREEFLDELNLAPSLYTGGYSRAGHFAAFVSETYGWESLLELDDALTPEATPAAIDAAFVAVLGSGLDDVVAAYADYPDCLNIVDNAIACAAEPENELDDWGTVEYERIVDCASPTGLGPNGGWAFVEGIVELPEDNDGTRLVVMTGDGHDYGGAVYLSRCGPCSEGGTLIVRDPVLGVPESELPAGRYLARLYAPADAGAVTIGVSIQ